MGPALTVAIFKTFIFVGREITNKWSAEAISQWIVTTLPCSSQLSNFGHNQLEKLEILLPHKCDVLGFVSADKTLVSLNIFCMHMNNFLSAFAAMQ